MVSFYVLQKLRYKIKYSSWVQNQKLRRLVNFMVLSILGLFLIILAELSLSFHAYKDRINRSQRSKVVYRANCWDCDSFYVGLG